MGRIGTGMRRAGLIAAGIACIAAGAAFAFGLFEDGGVAGASNSELGAVVALLVLPALTLGALRLDASVKRSARGT